MVIPKEKWKNCRFYSLLTDLVTCNCKAWPHLTYRVTHKGWDFRDKLTLSVTSYSEFLDWDCHIFKVSSRLHSLILCKYGVTLYIRVIQLQIMQWHIFIWKKELKRPSFPFVLAIYIVPILVIGFIEINKKETTNNFFLQFFNHFVFLIYFYGRGFKYFFLKNIKHKIIEVTKLCMKRGFLCPSERNIRTSREVWRMKNKYQLSETDIYEYVLCNVLYSVQQIIGSTLCLQSEILKYLLGLFVLWS